MVFKMLADVQLAYNIASKFISKQSKTVLIKQCLVIIKSSCDQENV